MSLLNATIFVILAFQSTNHAMAGEQALIQANIQQIILPLPTAISASCGLAIKIWPADQAACTQILAEQQLDFTLYLGSKKTGHESYEPISTETKA